MLLKTVLKPASESALIDGFMSDHRDLWPDHQIDVPGKNRFTLVVPENIPMVKERRPASAHDYFRQ